jgi:hypothetical protein
MAPGRSARPHDCSILPAMSELMVRTYAGRNQMDAARLYAEDAPNLATDGWVPVTMEWVADEWSIAAVALAAVLVLVVIGIILLVLMAVFKPTRTLLVTYRRESAAVT